MKIRTFTAADMPSALKQIRAALGPDAVILGSQKEPGRSSIRVTAAIDADAGQTSFDDYRETIEFAKRRNDQREWLREMTKVLEFHRVPEALMAQIKRQAEKADLNALLTLQKLTNASSKTIVQNKALATALKESFSFNPVDTTQAGKRICFVGPMGAGKTLTTAKFTTQLVMRKQPVSVITLDTQRAGAIEQLSKYTDILNIELKIAEDKPALLQHIKSIPLSHVTLIDTPGCNPRDKEESDALLGMIDTSGIEPILVIPGGLDSEESMEIAHNLSRSTIKRLIITRMDAARRYGNVLAAAAEIGLTFSHYSQSASVTDPCYTLNEDDLATFLLYHTQTAPKASQHKGNIL